MTTHSGVEIIYVVTNLNVIFTESLVGYRNRNQASRY